MRLNYTAACSNTVAAAAGELADVYRVYRTMFRGRYGVAYRLLAHNGYNELTSRIAFAVANAFLMGYLDAPTRLPGLALSATLSTGQCVCKRCVENRAKIAHG